MVHRPPPLQPSKMQSVVKQVDNKAEGSLIAEPPLAMPSDEEWVTLDLKVRSTRRWGHRLPASIPGCGASFQLTGRETTFPLLVVRNLSTTTQEDNTGRPAFGVCLDNCARLSLRITCFALLLFTPDKPKLPRTSFSTGSFWTLSIERGQQCTSSPSR